MFIRSSSMLELGRLARQVDPRWIIAAADRHT
jgi:hypothetical protein